MHPTTPAGFDWWAAEVVLETEGAWTFRVEGWDDPWETWVHNAEIKIPAGIDVALVCTEGKALFSRCRRARPGRRRRRGRRPARARRPPRWTPSSRWRTGSRTCWARTCAPRWRVHGPRELVSPSPDYPVFVDRRGGAVRLLVRVLPPLPGRLLRRGRRALGVRHLRHLARAAGGGRGDGLRRRLPAADPPDRHRFRKGPNNTLTPGPADPGSPWAIGNVEGGHDAIHPDLGDFDAFDRFVAKAKSLGLEIAMDFALQASPDHPWVTDHPEWFSARGRRVHRLRGEPAEEVPGHLPDQLRPGPRRHLRREPAHPQALDEPRRPHLPRRQPAHQARRLLGLDPGARSAGPTPTCSSSPRPSPSRR